MVKKIKEAVVLKATEKPIVAVKVAKKSQPKKKTSKKVSKSKIDIDLLTKQLVKDIVAIRVQGATNVARAILEHLKIVANALPKDMPTGEFVDRLTKMGQELSFLRITEPMARNAVDFLKTQLNAVRNTNIVTLKKVANETVDDFLKWINELDDKMAVDGIKIVRNGQKILTHCHSSSAERILIEAHKQGKQFQVFNTETRPLYQGRITAKHLLEAGIPTTLVVDDSASFLISEYSGKELMMNLVVMGCDSISLDGGCVNKVGSFGIAQSAYYEGVDVYIAASLLKVDINDESVKEIRIEQRNSKEIWPDAPKGLKMINFAFDRIPPRFIKGYITEFGIIKPKHIKKMAKRNYRWMFE